MRKIVLVTGGFDPIHSGHIAHFEAAKALGDILVVGVNSDAWLERKKGRAFMSWEERAAIIENLKMVDEVIAFDDSDGSARAACRAVRSKYADRDDVVIFANGGDRNSKNVVEMDVPGITFAFGVGGDNKKNSSSWILDEWKAAKTQRAWGYYRVLHEVPGVKVKELTIDPGQKLSMQRHSLRAEYWLVSSGKCDVNSRTSSGYSLPPVTLTPHMEYKVPVHEWHQILNPYDEPCSIVEIQYGENCIEADIERDDPWPR